MNLLDYHKMARAVFAGSDDLERILDLMEQVWASGQRSGAATSAERGRKSCLFNEWNWGEGVLHELENYALSGAPDGAFATRGDARMFVCEQLGAMGEWAGSQEADKRKMDWTLAAKGWIRRTLQSPTFQGQPRQTSLFGPTQTTPSRPYKSVEEVHREVLQKAIDLNSQRVPPSQWSTSSDTDSPETPVESPSSSRTLPRSH